METDTYVLWFLGELQYLSLWVIESLPQKYCFSARCR